MTAKPYLYQLGDIATPYGPLRLTVSGLAELADCWDASTPSALADRVRDLRPDDVRRLLTTLLRPSGRPEQAASLSDVDVLALLPAVTACLVQALASGEGTSTHAEQGPKDQSPRWPFANWHRLAVRQLQIPPNEFWAMPLRDWLTLITSAPPAIGLTDLHALMKDFPDE